MKYLQTMNKTQRHPVGNLFELRQNLPMPQPHAIHSPWRCLRELEVGQ